MVTVNDVWGCKTASSLLNCNQPITEKGPTLVSLRGESMTTAKNPPKSLSTRIFSSLWVEASPGGLKGSVVGIPVSSNELN